MFRITISSPMCKNCINFADTVGIYKYHHFGEQIPEIGPSFLKLSGKYKVLWGHPMTLKTPKICLVRDVAKCRNKYDKQTKIRNVFSED